MKKLNIVALKCPCVHTDADKLILCVCVCVRALGRTGLPPRPPQGKVWYDGVSPQHRPGRKRLSKYLKVCWTLVPSVFNFLAQSFPQSFSVTEWSELTHRLFLELGKISVLGPHWRVFVVLCSSLQRGLEAGVDNKLHHLRATVSISSELNSFLRVYVSIVCFLSLLTGVLLGNSFDSCGAIMTDKCLMSLSV